MEEEDIDKDKSQVAQVAAQGVFAQRKSCNWLLQVITVAAGPWPGRRGGQVGLLSSKFFRSSGIIPRWAVCAEGQVTVFLAL